jgi:hypothetical protein
MSARDATLNFTDLCAAPGVRERIAAIEGDRRAALARFWKRLVLGLALAAAAFATLLYSGWDTVAVVVGIVFAIFAAVAAASPLMEAKEALKHPVLEEIARRAGMEYLRGDFTPPAYASARPLLFGGGLTSQTFTDLFHGADSEGRGFAFYEACLQRRVGRNTTTVFSGQIYALHRRPGRTGVTVIAPDRKIFNFWKPASDMERVRIEGDEAFERRFEAYSTDPAEARLLLSDILLRQRLLALRESGRVQVFVGPEEALVAVGGKDRFEPGSMFRSRPGEERVRMMLDDVCASLAVLDDLKARLG